MGEYGTLARWLKEQFKRPDLDMSIYIYTYVFKSPINDCHKWKYKEIYIYASYKIVMFNIACPII